MSMHVGTEVTDGTRRGVVCHSPYGPMGQERVDVQWIGAMWGIEATKLADVEEVTR